MSDYLSKLAVLEYLRNTGPLSCLQFAIFVVVIYGLMHQSWARLIAMNAGKQQRLPLVDEVTDRAAMFTALLGMVLTFSGLFAAESGGDGGSYATRLALGSSALGYSALAFVLAAQWLEAQWDTWLDNAMPEAPMTVTIPHADRQSTATNPAAIPRWIGDEDPSDHQGV